MGQESSPVKDQRSNLLTTVPRNQPKSIRSAENRLHNQLSDCRFWKSSLPLEGLEQIVQNLTLDGIPYKDTVDTGLGAGGDKKGQTDEDSRKECVEEIATTTVIKRKHSDSEEEKHMLIMAKETEEIETAEMEQLTAAEVEEKKTFAIKSVVNPEDGTEIALQQAIVLGIIQPDEGVYVNIVTGETKPIASAMSEGLIKVRIRLPARLRFPVQFIFLHHQRACDFAVLQRFSVYVYALLPTQTAVAGVYGFYRRLSVCLSARYLNTRCS